MDEIRQAKIKTDVCEETLWEDFIKQLQIVHNSMVGTVLHNCYLRVARHHYAGCHV